MGRKRNPFEAISDLALVPKEKGTGDLRLIDKNLSPYNEHVKGEKIYNLAKAIHEKMYAKSSPLADKLELYTQYFKLIKKAAYKGHPESQYIMGNLHEDIGYLGIPNPMHNPRRACYWYTKASQKGHAEAYNNLANLYELGLGCKQDIAIALSLYKLSANAGSPNGKKNYRLMLRDMSDGGKYGQIK